jgi:hypothetical protein
VTKRSVALVAKKPIIGALLAILVAYVVYPYIALYRLGQAVRQGDAPLLESLVDWYAVREGIKEDICDLVIDEPPEAKINAPLPPFGASFVRGIATNSVDRRVTPEALVLAARTPETNPVPQDAPLQVSWAFFAGPAEFLVDLRAPGQLSSIRLQMDLRGGTWQVTRVWLPPEMLGQARRT